MVALDLHQAAKAAALLGGLFHFVVCQFEFEKVMFHFMAASVLTALGLAYSFGILSTVVIIASFNTALLASISIYRMFFHRLRKFPGPIGARLTKFHAMRLSAKHVQYNKELAKWHEQYGDIVRTGPRELSVLRPAALQIIYGPNSEARKSTWYGQAGNDAKKCSIHMTRDFDQHRARRRAWDRGFSIKALSTYEPRIKAKADLLVRELAKRAGTSMDATQWSMFFSFDIMGDIGFGKDFANLASGTEHPAIKAIHAHMTMLGIVSTVPWLLNLLGSIPGAAAGYSEFFSFCAGQIREKNKRWDSKEYPQDVVSWLLKAVKDNDPSAAPSPEALEDDSRVVIIAGSETTATVLASALFFLAKHPHLQRKLQRFLDAALPDGYTQYSYDKIKGVSYLDDFINETMRLRPALFTGGARVTPAKGLRIDDVYIPGNTNVVVPVSLVQKDPRWWVRAGEFVPERFGEAKGEMGTGEAPYLPFSMGAYSCPGKNLALLSLRTSLAAIAMNFDVGFAEGETGEAFEHEVLDTFTVTLPPLRLVFSQRK